MKPISPFGLGLNFFARFASKKKNELYLTSWKSPLQAEFLLSLRKMLAHTSAEISPPNQKFWLRPCPITHTKTCRQTAWKANATDVKKVSFSRFTKMGLSWHETIILRSRSKNAQSSAIPHMESNINKYFRSYVKEAFFIYICYNNYLHITGHLHINNIYYYLPDCDTLRPVSGTRAHWPSAPLAPSPSVQDDSLRTRTKSGINKDTNWWFTTYVKFKLRFKFAIKSIKSQSRYIFNKFI